MNNTHICLVCGMQFRESFARCPQCKYNSVYSKQEVGHRLVKDGKYKGYYAMSVSHLNPKPCKKCGGKTTQVSNGYRVCCGNKECDFFLVHFDTWVWNAMAGEDASTVTIGIGEE